MACRTQYHRAYIHGWKMKIESRCHRLLRVKINEAAHGNGPRAIGGFFRYSEEGIRVYALSWTRWLPRVIDRFQPAESEISRQQMMLCTREVVPWRSILSAIINISITNTTRVMKNFKLDCSNFFESKRVLWLQKNIMNIVLWFFFTLIRNTCVL